MKRKLEIHPRITGTKKSIARLLACGEIKEIMMEEGYDFDLENCKKDTLVQKVMKETLVRALQKKKNTIEKEKSSCENVASEDAKVLKFSCAFFNRNQLPDIMYNAITSRKMKNVLENETFRIINLDDIDINESLQKKRIGLQFRIYKGDEIDFAGVMGYFSTPAYQWTAQPPDFKSIKDSFNKISCDRDQKSDCIKTTPCHVGKSKYKLFYCKARDLSDYMKKVNDNIIPKPDHDRIFTIISQWERFKNHNMDVPILHFK